jgi:hypothetical protein
MGLWSMIRRPRRSILERYRAFKSMIPKVAYSQPRICSAGHLPMRRTMKRTMIRTSIIFEIPPELDDRQVREALSQHPGRDFERLAQQNGVDALGWYLPFHQRIAQHGIYISSAGASATAGAFVAPAISRASSHPAPENGMGRIPRLARSSCVPRAPARTAGTYTRSATRPRRDPRTQC